MLQHGLRERTSRWYVVLRVRRHWRWMITRCGHVRERKSDYRFRCMGGNRQWLRVRDAYGDMDNKDYTASLLYRTMIVRVAVRQIPITACRLCHNVLRSKWKTSSKSAAASTRRAPAIDEGHWGHWTLPTTSKVRWAQRVTPL